MVRGRAVRLARLGVLVALSIAAAGCDTAVPAPPAPPPVYAAVDSDFDPGFPLPPVKPCAEGLLEAARHRDLASVARLAAARVDFNCGDPAHPAPLDLAVMQGASDLVDALLDAGADPSRRWGPHGDRFPLQEAVELPPPFPGRSTDEAHLPRLPMVRALLEHGADPNARWCPFESRVGMTLRSGRVIPGCRSSRGVTPLSMAAREDRPDFVRLLLDAGADPRIEVEWGRTPLEYARSERVVELLLPAPPAGFIGSPQARLEARWTEAAREFRARHSDPADDRGLYESALTDAIGSNSIARARLMLRSGVYPNSRAGYGDDTTALARAARWGEAWAVDALLAAGAGVDLRSCGRPVVVERDPWYQGCRTDAGATPLMLAALGQRVAIVKRLLEAGADPGLRDWRGRTAYDYACHDGPPRPELEVLRVSTNTARWPS